MIEFVYNLSYFVFIAYEENHNQKYPTCLKGVTFLKLRFLSA